MLSDIRHVINSCQNYLENTKTKGTTLESYLTKYLLISICAEYEKEIKRIVHRKAINPSNDDLTSFIIKKTDVRSLRISELKGNILKLFNDSYPITFQNSLDQTDSTLKYSNIVENRNLAAHGESINMSFDEVVDTYESAEVVLQIFSNVLNS